MAEGPSEKEIADEEKFEQKSTEKKKENEEEKKRKERPVECDQ